jgi:hypothetical protein
MLSPISRAHWARNLVGFNDRGTTRAGARPFSFLLFSDSPFRRRDKIGLQPRPGESRTPGGTAFQDSRQLD